MLRSASRQKRPDRRVRHEAVAHRALFVVELELLDDRPVEDDQRFRTRRVAAVLDAIDRIRHRFAQRNQNRHVFRTAAGHHAVHRDRPDRHCATLRQHDAERLFGLAIGEAQELFDLLDGRRNDRQPVAPLALIEVFVDLLERAAEDDVARGRLGRQLRSLRLRQQVVDHLRGGDVEHVLPQFPRRSARRDGRRSSPPADWACQGRPTSRRPDRGNPRRPETMSEIRLVRTLHWPATRRACNCLNTPCDEMAASTPNSLKRCGSEASNSFSFTRMGRAELAPADQLHVGIFFAQLLFERLEHFVAGEEIVPELRDRLAVERVEPLRQRTLLQPALAARPDDFIFAVSRFLAIAQSFRYSHRNDRRAVSEHKRLAPAQLRTVYHVAPFRAAPQLRPRRRLLPSPRRHCHHNRRERRPPRTRGIGRCKTRTRLDVSRRRQATRRERSRCSAPRR